MAKSYKLTLEYDGGAYVGWQAQSNGPSIQAEVEKALSTALRRGAKATASGRTDSGVHARAQVASVEAEEGDPDPFKLQGNLNGLLPADIKVVSCEWAPGGFHARYDAEEKTYRYQWLNRRAPSPLWGRVSWHQPLGLDVEAMRRAAECLVGRHDFSAFRAAECSAKGPHREVKSLRLWADGERVIMEITADAFLMHMVRNIAGTLAEVGQGKRPENEVKSALESLERAQAGPTAPAQGLCLWSVKYGEIPRPSRS